MRVKFEEWEIPLPYVGPRKGHMAILDEEHGIYVAFINGQWYGCCVHDNEDWQPISELKLIKAIHVICNNDFNEVREAITCIRDFKELNIYAALEASLEETKKRNSPT